MKSDSREMGTAGEGDLEELVAAALEIRDQGIEPDLDVLCAAHPGLRSRVAEALDASSRFQEMHSRAAAHDRLQGKSIGDRYDLVDRLGAGAMGVVYRSVDSELRRPVAVKILRSAFLDGLEAEARFAREAEALAAIEHENVVTIHDRGRTEDGDPYLVMELLEGVSLADLLEEGKAEGSPNGTSWVARKLGLQAIGEQSYLRLVVRWCIELAGGLSAAHSKGIFHRDVKPSNVFLRSNGRPVLLDFGNAARTSQATLTRGGPVGTPAYMAPETLESVHSPDVGLDVYGLSATLYHMLTLRAPYTGSPSQILGQLMQSDPTPADHHRQGIPRDLLAIVEKGMARDLRQRYSSMDDLERDLRAFLEYLPVTARRVSPLERAWRRVRRSNSFKLAIVLFILGALGWVVRDVQEGVRKERSATFYDAWGQLTPNLGVNWRAESRKVRSSENRKTIGDLLDVAVQNAPSAVPSRVIRAAFLLDQGEVERAASDMSSVSAELETPLAKELARRYEAIAGGLVDSIDLDGLEAPQTQEDRYLLAVHLRRDHRHAEARQLLEEADMLGYLPADELRLGLFESADDMIAMLSTAVALEERLGVRTATTAGFQGLALLIQKEYEQAMPLFLEAEALAPPNFFVKNNLGRLLLQVGDLEGARERLESAIQLNPFNLRAYRNLVLVLRRSGQLAEATRVVEESPYDETDPASLARKLELLGEIETEKALAAESDADAHELALGAVDLFLEVEDLGYEVRRSHFDISRAIVDGEPEPVFSGLLRILGDDPLSDKRLRLLATWLPDDPTSSQVESIRTLIEHIASQVSSD